MHRAPEVVLDDLQPRAVGLYPMALLPCDPWSSDFLQWSYEALQQLYCSYLTANPSNLTASSYDLPQPVLLAIALLYHLITYCNGLIIIISLRRILQRTYCILRVCSEIFVLLLITIVLLRSNQGYLKTRSWDAKKVNDLD